MARNRNKNTNRFAATLLFQFRVVAGGRPNKRRLVEKRIALFEASTALQALRRAKAYGRAAQHNYLNGDGGTVFFEFVGVLDLLHLGIECDSNEVWYEIGTMMTPMERRKTLLPARYQDESGSTR